jgi:hypothetical protein
MKYLKSYKKYNEDVAFASTAGMGSVSNSQPGGFAGDVSGSTPGSGDIPFYLKRNKGKKGSPSEVSDLRDLEEVDVEEIDDLKEGFIFENKSDIRYNWVVLYFDNIKKFSNGETGQLLDIFWAEDMNELYHILKDNIFDNEDEELTYTNIPYDEWCGWANEYKIIRAGEKEPRFQICLDSDNCWNDFLDFYNNAPLNENKVVNFKVFESSNKYNWLITYQDYDSDEENIIWCEDMNDVYKSIKGNLFIDEENEIDETNIPYSEWHGGNVYIKIYKYGQNHESFQIHLQSDDTWNDFLIFYNEVPLNESKKKFPNIKKMEIDGFEVLMGKDADSNDYLTIQMRKDGDLWFHAHGFPGSHIILRCGDRIPDQNTKKKVAELAAKNSKASGLATVICCPINLVKKESGSNPGKVKIEDSLNIEKIDINL